MKYLIVGLGNIGPEYHETRHNIGFMAVDALAKAAGATFTDGRYGFTTTLSVKGRQLLLLKPSTFMNLSGNAVRYWMQKENIPLENVLVVVDDLALPFGTLRLKGKGFPVYKKEGQFGDLIITYSVKIPTNLTDRQKELFRELQQSMN
jgi:PTH1 family peptidyl-tRNA hydrolase